MCGFFARLLVWKIYPYRVKNCGARSQTSVEWGGFPGKLGAVFLPGLCRLTQSRQALPRTCSDVQDVPYDSPREGGYGYGGIYGIGAEPPLEMPCVSPAWQDFGTEHKEEEGGKPEQKPIELQCLQPLSMQQGMDSALESTDGTGPPGNPVEWAMRHPPRMRRVGNIIQCRKGEDGRDGNGGFLNHGKTFSMQS